MTKAGEKLLEGLHEAITMTKLMKENERLRAENEKLRAALKGVIADMNGTQFPQTNVRAISVGALNAAAAALKETGDE